jgi:hypothetical protein
MALIAGSRPIFSAAVSNWLWATANGETWSIGVIIRDVTLLRVSDSNQVYDVDLPDLRITPDQGGGYYIHGKGYFLFFEELEEAEEKKKELDFRGAY